MNDQESIVSKELEKVILKRDQLNKVCQYVEADFTSAVWERREEDGPIFCFKN